MPEFNMLVDNVNINYGKKMANLFTDGKMKWGGRIYTQKENKKTNPLFNAKRNKKVMGWTISILIKNSHIRGFLKHDNM